MNPPIGEYVALMLAGSAASWTVSGSKQMWLLKLPIGDYVALMLAGSAASWTVSDSKQM
jgi:hypothetical protein